MPEGAVHPAHGIGTDVSVVVSTYDERRWQELCACLESLSRQSQSPGEVIVVVDHNPVLLARARGRFGWATVVENRRRRGLAGARNTGIDEAGGEIVAFIDDDASADPDWVRQLGRSFDDPHTVGVGGAVIPRWATHAPSWMPSEFLWVVGCSYTGLPDRVAPIRNPIGANMAVRTAALREIGGFREGDDHDQPRNIRERGVVRAAGNIPDDTDLAIRVNQRWPDAVWLYQPDAAVHHFVPAERASPGYFMRRSFEEGGGKASLARLVGSDTALASERRHAASVLPRGIVNELRRFLRGDGSAGLRALAIAAGLLAAAAGFGLDTAQSWFRR